eukprot:602396-Prymnesium_polylepis.1
MSAMASQLRDKPRVVTSKLAYAIFPEVDSVKPLNYHEKKLADAPHALWSEGDIMLYFPEGPVDITKEGAKEEPKEEEEEQHGQPVDAIDAMLLAEDGEAGGEVEATEAAGDATEAAGDATEAAGDAIEAAGEATEAAGEGSA